MRRGIHGERPSLLLVGAAVVAGVVFASGCNACGKPSAGPAPPASAASSALAPAPLAASDRPRLPASTRQGSVLAYAPDGSVLYVADEDASVLHLVPLPFGKDNPTRAVALPGRPAQVVARDGEVLVTIRDPGLLLVLRPDPGAGLVEAARVALPADAWGLALTGDEKTVLVSSAWTHRVSGVDLASGKVRFSVDVAREPRGIAVLADGSRAYVSHLVGSALTRIDGIGGDQPAVKRVALPAAPLRTEDASTRAEDASLGYALTFSEDERRLFVARHALGGHANDQWAGVPTVDVLLPRDDSPFIARRRPPHVGARRALETDETPDKDGMVRVPTLDLPVTSFSQPRAVVRRPREGSLLVVGEGNGVLFELDAHALDPSSMARHSYPLKDGSRKDARPCGAPSGIAVSQDDRFAYVFCRSTNQLAVVTLPAPETQGKHLVSVTPLGEGPRDAELAEGRRLFYDATDATLTDVTSCAGCHPEGRDDGFTWTEVHGEMYDGFVADPPGAIFQLPRQTPMLAGRVAAAGPYGWLGESATLEDRIRAGFWLHRMYVFVYSDNGEPPDKTVVPKARALARFLRTGLVTPPRAAGPLSEVEKRGQALFESGDVGCRTCHGGPEYTDRFAMHLQRWTVREGFSEEREGKPEDVKFKIPSLLFVGGTPPYYHDGSAATLEELVEHDDDRMGKTRQLGAADRAALVAFLRTL